MLFCRSLLQQSQMGSLEGGTSLRKWQIERNWDRKQDKSGRSVGKYQPAQSLFQTWLYRDLTQNKGQYSQLTTFPHCPWDKGLLSTMWVLVAASSFLFYLDYLFSWHSPACVGVDNVFFLMGKMLLLTALKETGGSREKGLQMETESHVDYHTFPICC